MLEVLFDLLKWLWRDDCLWRDDIDLSKQSEKSAKCRPVAAKRPLVLRSETKVLHHETLVHVTNIEMLAGQPLTEITHNSDTARPTLIALNVINLSPKSPSGPSESPRLPIVRQPIIESTGD
jgi:hypothetical protein